MATESLQEEHTKLMTLLNVSAAHPRNIKRPRPAQHDWSALAAKARKVALSASAKEENPAKATTQTTSIPENQDQSLAADTSSEQDAYQVHFAPETSLLKPSLLEAVDSHAWTQSAPTETSSLGPLVDYTPAVPQDILKETQKLVQNVTDRTSCMPVVMLTCPCTTDESATTGQI